ncbi:MAG: DUF4136 domain-containing protein [Bacteroidetes bacterium]|nr:DUF4136 domain-containing protein [Bacteroidota bacterium]
MKTKITLFILGLGLFFTLGCSKYPPSSDRLLEDLAVITQYDTKVNFNDYKTFGIASSITKIDNKDTSELSNSVATSILDEISKQMTSRGFTKAAAGTLPDLGIQVVYYENTNVYTYSYYNYWWGYPYSYYGYYYPYYPVYYSSYTTGLADIQLIDLKNPNVTTQQLYLRWNAYIRGLVTGGHTTSEIINAVDMAFTQTPQLATSAK